MYQYLIYLPSCTRWLSCSRSLQSKHTMWCLFKGVSRVACTGLTFLWYTHKNSCIQTGRVGHSHTQSQKANTHTSALVRWQWRRRQRRRRVDLHSGSSLKRKPTWSQKHTAGVDGIIKHLSWVNKFRHLLNLC